MKNRSPLRHRLCWSAVATLGILFLLPASRHLLGMQINMQANAFSYTTERDPSVERAVASHQPKDYPLQLALASDVPSVSDSESAAKAIPTAASKARTERLRALTLRFPNNPSVYANLLRYMSFADVKIWYGEKGKGASAVSPVAISPSPESLAMFAAAAQQGALLDPDNAYFPMMQAMSLFAAHREGEAVDALKAASRCTRWNEYFTDDLAGRLRLQRASYGEPLATQQMDTMYALLFPQYAQLRAMARAAVHLAAAEELAGKAAEGLAVRHALMRCGGLMRAQGASSISSLVGIAIANIATMDPAGVKTPPPPATGKGEETQQSRDLRAETRRNRYYAYLENQGQTPEASWARTELTAGIQAKAILLEGSKNPVNSGLRLAQFNGAWLLNLILLSSAAVVLMLGAMAHYARLGGPWKGRMAKLLPFCQGSNALVAIVWIGVWQWAAIENGFLPLVDIHSLYADSSRAGSAADELAVVQGVVLGLSLLIPLLLVSLIAFLSRRQSVPLATGLGRGLRGVALPVAAALLLVYGVSLLPTAYFESILKKDIARTVSNEPHYVAELAHKTWPGDPQP